MDLDRVYSVGGSVRDGILSACRSYKIKCSDHDYVCVGYTHDEMVNLGFRKIDASFPIYSHPSMDGDFALARKEVKTGEGHRDFKIVFDNTITLEEDLERRDFTMNAIAYHHKDGTYIDPFNGISDIRHNIIRHVNEDHFKEDPLRILRALRFSVTLGFTIHESTMVLLRDMVSDGMLKNLTAERIWIELEKSLDHCYFFKFMILLDSIGGVHDIFPEIDVLKLNNENILHHPEGNTFNHTMMCLANVPVFMAANASHLKSMVKYINFGLLVHDIGKARGDGKTHDTYGQVIIKDLCSRLKVPNNFKKYALVACKYHMRTKPRSWNDYRVSTKYDFINEITNGMRNKEYLNFIWAVSLIDTCSRGVSYYHLEARASIFSKYSSYVSVVDKDQTIDEYDLVKEEQSSMFDSVLRMPKSLFDCLASFTGHEYGIHKRSTIIKYLSTMFKRRNNNEKRNITNTIG